MCFRTKTLPLTSVKRMILATCTAALSAPIFLLMHSNWLLDISIIPNHWNLGRVVMRYMNTSSFWAVSNWKITECSTTSRGCQNLPLWKILRSVFWGINLSPFYLRQGRKQIFPSIFGSSSCSDEMTQLTRLWLSWKKYSEASVWSSPNGGSNILSPQKGCSPLESSWSLVSCRHPEERREKNVQKMGQKHARAVSTYMCILLHQGVWSISYNVNPPRG